MTDATAACLDWKPPFGKPKAVSNRGRVSAANQLPSARYSLEGTGTGFDIWHEPKDDAPCDVRNGQCHLIDHLEPIARLEEQ